MRGLPCWIVRSRASQCLYVMPCWNVFWQCWGFRVSIVPSGDVLDSSGDYQLCHVCGLSGWYLFATEVFRLHQLSCQLVESCAAVY